MGTRTKGFSEAAFSHFWVNIWMFTVWRGLVAGDRPPTPLRHRKCTWAADLRSKLNNPPKMPMSSIWAVAGSPFLPLLRSPDPAEGICMENSTGSAYSSRTTVAITVEGRIALAADALASAEKTPNQERRRGLCEQAIHHLRLVVGA